jgi:hypothetical protein
VGVRVCGTRRRTICHTSGGQWTAQIVFQPLTVEAKRMRWCARLIENATESRHRSGRDVGPAVSQTDPLVSSQRAVDDFFGDYSQFHVVIASMEAHPRKGILDLQPTSPDQDSLRLF